MSDGGDTPIANSAEAKGNPWRWTRVVAALAFALSVAAAAVAQTPPAYIGLAVMAVLCLMMAFIGVAKPHHYAAGAFAVAAILAGAGIVVQPSWQVKGPDFLKLAISPALFGVSMMFWAEREGGARHWTNNVAGILATAVIAGIAYVSLFGDFDDYFSSPWLAVVLLAMTGLANLAGKAWVWPLSIVATPTMAAILARHLLPGLPNVLTSWMDRALHWLSTAQVWPIGLAAVVWLLFCLQQRPGRQATLVGLLVVVLVGVIAREVWMLAGVGAGK